jgi:hypothetical protein
MTAPKRKHIIPRRPIAAIEANGHDPEPPPVDLEPVEIGLEMSGPEGNGSSLPVPSQTVPLPVFDYRVVNTQIPNPDGPGTVTVTSAVPVMSRAVLRQCSSCSLAAVCPLFNPGDDCHYSIPIEIRNRDQLMGTLSSLLEVQGQRIAFARFSEELQGGYPDANLSLELDRFMRMTLSFKEIQDNRDVFKMTVEGHGEPGLFRRLFGDRTEMLHPVDPDQAERAVRKAME